MPVGLKDYSVQKPKSFALPPAGGIYIDPCFGSEVRRITDQRDGMRCVNAYSYWPALNCNSTRLLIALDGVPWIYIFDPITGVARKDKTLWVPEHPAKIQFEGASWSQQYPTSLFALDWHTPTLWKVRVSSPTTFELRKDFSQDTSLGKRALSHLTMSSGGTVFAFLSKREGNTTEAHVWSATDNFFATFVPPRPGDGINEIQMTKGGTRAVVIMNGGQAHLWAFRLGWVIPLSNPASHWDNGKTQLVNGDGVMTGIQARSYGTPIVPSVGANVFQYFKSDGKTLNWTIAEHVSLRSEAENFALVSTYGKGTIDQPFEKELILVKIAFSTNRNFMRLAHTQSTGSADPYWSQPRAVISKDGQWAVWTSDMGTSRLDVFATRIPEGVL